MPANAAVRVTVEVGVVLEFFADAAAAVVVIVEEPRACVE
jgi:hypothetical protein